MVIDRLAVWWLARQGYFKQQPYAGAALAVAVRGRALQRKWPRWLRITLQSVFGALVVLAALGYFWRYSLLGAAPGP